MPNSPRSLLALPLAGCGNAGDGGTAPGPQACQLGPITTLPLTNSDEGYLTDTELNRHRASMIVNTGAQNSIISGR